MTWNTSIATRSNVQQGRLNTSDVECLFFLGCDGCSETLATVSADKVAGLMSNEIASSAPPAPIETVAITEKKPMTKAEMQARIELLSDEMNHNDEENRDMQSEIDGLYKKIDALPPDEN
ncbi:hypothetical protein [Massilia sp. MP_M2]|uniref:hypothetical protein n=1 Tax=Massilia sp. MP_M2 TaxID=3071713 RepID=UPI00319E5BEB